MNNNIPLYLCLVFGGLLLSAPVSAQENDDADLGSFIDGSKWQEGEVTIPKFPNRDDLIKVEVDRVDMPFSFYIDPASLSVGKDSITRYTVVIESDTGASNVMYEGIRCWTNEYQTYAYGTYDNAFSKARSSSWKKITSSGAMAHRYNFKRYYLCSNHGRPLQIRESLRRIRYPEDFATGGDLSDR